MRCCLLHCASLSVVIMFPSVDEIQKLNHLGEKSTKRYFHVAIICNAAQKGSNF